MSGFGNGSGAKKKPTDAISKAAAAVSDPGARLREFGAGLLADAKSLASKVQTEFKKVIEVDSVSTEKLVGASTKQIGDIGRAAVKEATELWAWPARWPRTLP